MSESKIQIKIGIVEFSGEGNEEWLAAQFDRILDKIPEFLKIEMTAPKTADVQNTSSQQIPSSGTINLSMANIAAKLNCKSGQDVATAAAAYSKFVLSKSSFNRDDILENMKKATGYFKSSYSNNLTNILGALVKNGTLLESSTNNYSLQVNKETELNGILSR